MDEAVGVEDAAEEGAEAEEEAGHGPTIIITNLAKKQKPNEEFGKNLMLAILFILLVWSLQDTTQAMRRQDDDHGNRKERPSSNPVDYRKKIYTDPEIIKFLSKNKIEDVSQITGDLGIQLNQLVQKVQEMDRCRIDHLVEKVGEKARQQKNSRQESRAGHQKPKTKTKPMRSACQSFGNQKRSSANSSKRDFRRGSDRSATYGTYSSDYSSTPQRTDSSSSESSVSSDTDIEYRRKGPRR